MYKNLLRPFSYLAIDHPQKWIVDWAWPAVGMVLSTITLMLSRHFGSISVFADSGLVGKVLGVFQNMPGFYIAALAAIATFNRVDIDRTMPAPAPKLDISVHGKMVPIELTRRRFLCSMFAFLTAENFVLIFLAISGQVLVAPLKAVLPSWSHEYAVGIFSALFFLVFWQMIITTFWGLFYLGDKLHQPDA